MSEMTDEEIIELFCHYKDGFPNDDPENPNLFGRFGKAVIQCMRDVMMRERRSKTDEGRNAVIEECARVADMVGEFDLPAVGLGADALYDSGYSRGCKHVARRIRALTTTGGK